MKYPEQANAGDKKQITSYQGLKEQVMGSDCWLWGFFWGDESVLELVVMDAQLCKYTKNTKL